MSPSRHPVLSGMPVCRNGRFLQVLEGPEEQVDEKNDVNATTAAVRELVRWFETRPTPTM